MTPELVHQLLGAPRFLDEEMEERTKNPGVAIGLAWTPVGGEVLLVEASRMAGTGSLTLTGQLGDVMKESARAALSWVRAHATEWAIDPEFFKGSEIHVHVPSGAIPKDGPSAGVTMVDGARVGAGAAAGARRRGDDRRDHALGPRAAGGRHQGKGACGQARSGSSEIILPRQNEKNVNEDLNDELREGLTIHLVNTIDEVLLLALLPVVAARPECPKGQGPGASRARPVSTDARKHEQERRIVIAQLQCAIRDRMLVIVFDRLLRYHIDIGAHVFPTRNIRASPSGFSATAAPVRRARAGLLGRSRARAHTRVPPQAPDRRIRRPMNSRNSSCHGRRTSSKGFA